MSNSRIAGSLGISLVALAAATAAHAQTSSSTGAVPVVPDQADTARMAEQSDSPNQAPQPQSANPGTPDSESEIIVTANRREQSLQDVGISITAVTGAALKSQGVNSTQDIAQQIPALKLQSFSPAFTTFNLRGVSQNNFTDNLEAPVAVYFDDIYIGSMNAINQQLFDIERVEVLRGPQGTLFGRNATGGLIQYHTVKATRDDLNGYVSGSLARFDDRAIEGAVGGGLANDLRFRIGGRYNKADGYIKAGEFPEGVQHTGRDGLGANGYIIRGNLQYGGGSNPLLIDLSGFYSEDNNVPAQQYVVRFAEADPETGLGINAGPIITGSPWRHASDATFNRLDRRTYLASGRIAYDLTDDITAEYIGGYLDLQKTNVEDAGGGLFPFLFSSDADYSQWSHELRISENDGLFRWQVGAYRLSIDSRTFTISTGPVATGFDDGRFEGNTDTSSKNWSVFGQAEYDLSELVTVIGGLRYSKDNKRVESVNLGYNIDGEPGPISFFDFGALVASDPQYAGLNRISYGDWAGRLQVNYKPNDDVLLYASANRGIKGGNWTPSPIVTPEDVRHKREVLWAYEVGGKLTLPGGLGYINGSIYYYDYNDYQAFSLKNLFPQVKNTDANSHGGELEILLTPSQNWSINLGAAYIDSTVDSIEGVIPGTEVRDVEFPQAPRLSLNGLVRYGHDIGFGEASIQFDGTFSTRQYLEGTNSDVSRQKAYFLGNARIGVEATAGWDLSAFVKNVFNQAYLVYNLDLGAAGFVEQIYGAPRTYGITAGYKF